ncbi:MAG: RelA/SpoT family protein [Bacteroidetes bacterium]|nr:RelA/SpoT family protein [Bacteroidota bacterium]
MYIPDEESENKEIVRRYRNLLRVWYTRKTPADKKLVRKAFNLAVKAHVNDRRKTGEPYVYHPLDVARIAAEEIGLGTTSIVCALIHDVVEDTKYTLKDIQKLFGSNVAHIVDGLTKIDELFDDQTSSIQAENFRKMLLTLSEDVRVILIKLADRLHNMRTLDAMSKEKQVKIASETHYIYAPLAHRLGLYMIKGELEDLALKYLEPNIYNSISQKLIDSKFERNKFVRKLVGPLKKALNEQEIEYQIFASEKSVNSIWEKMREREIPFEEVHDAFAVKIIIDSPKKQEKIDCWKVYSIITDYYRPKMDHLRDRISIPKANGYEALHTTIMSHTGRWVEVQIQTTRMYDIGMKGYAAHLKYKSTEATNSGLENWLKRISELLQSSEENALDFLSDFKMNLFSDEVSVFTPKGELKNLPFGSTVLDFAYSIHSQVGNTSIGAKVNRKLVPLNYRVKNGDQIEMITSDKQKPRVSWLRLVVTARAKARIKQAIKEDRKSFKEKGTEILKGFFEQLNIEFTPNNIGILQSKTSYSGVIDLYYFVAKGKIELKDVKNAFHDNEKGNWMRYISIPFLRSKNVEPETLSKKIRESIRTEPEAMIIGGAVNDLNYTILPCCNPIPGDDVIGLISKDDMIRIHRINCPTAIQEMSKFGNRIVKAKWNKKESISFLAGLKIKSIDSIGLINHITGVISNEYHLNIRSFTLETSEGITEAMITLYVNDLKNLQDLIDELKKIKEIKMISRINRFSKTK